MTAVMRIDQRRVALEGQHHVLADAAVVRQARAPGDSTVMAVDVRPTGEYQRVESVALHELARSRVPPREFRVGELVVDRVRVPRRVADRLEVVRLVQLVAYLAPVVVHDFSVMRDG